MRQQRNKLYLIGIILGSISLFLFPIPGGIAGLVIGIILITKEALFRGVHVLMLSIICGAFGTIIGFARFGVGIDSTYYLWIFITCSVLVINLLVVWAAWENINIEK